MEGIGSGALDFKGVYHYGDDDDKNLLGTIRSLDMYQPKTLNCTLIGDKKVHSETVHCSWGIISQNGWHVVNDSRNQAISGEHDWAAGGNTDTVDNYFFGHGLDFKQALYEYNLVAGKVPMLPRYAFGVWWTRWYAWNDETVRSVVEEFDHTNTPLDVYVFDMNWHIKYGWGAFSFDRNLFPFPEDTMSYLKEKGLHISMNIHDDDGIRNYEDQFEAACQAMGLDPKKTGEIRFASCSNYAYAAMVEDVVLKPVEDVGTDFWWIDWQQGGAEGGCKEYSYNPTIWLNKVRATDAKRRFLQGITKDPEFKRNMALGRWGGLGNHRYQLGFSGDAPGIDWANLAFQPYFSATAANVGYGLWSNDLTAMGDNSEIYIRWTQFVAMSGIIRFHERGKSSGACAEAIYPDLPGGDANRLCSMWVPYDMPNNYMQIQRNTLKLRIRLVPYIYTEMKKFYDRGLAFMRPLYYDYPTQPEAYTALTIDGKKTQYMFGDSMMVAPIVEGVNKDNRMVNGLSIWMPPGQSWYELNSGLMLAGGSTLQKQWDISEIPVFIKAGAIIPQRLLEGKEVISTAQQIFSKLMLEIYPGAQTGEYTLFEDDGQSIAYLNGKYSLIHAQYTRSAESLAVNITSEVVKPWAQSDIQRTVGIKVLSSYPPRAVTYQLGQQEAIAIPYKQTGKNNELHWHFCPKEIAVVIVVPGLVLEKNQLLVQMTGDFSRNDLLNGLRGGISHAELAKQNLDFTHSTPATQSFNNASLLLAAGMGYKLAHYADPKFANAQFDENVKNYRQLILQAYDIVAKLKSSEEEGHAGLRSQLRVLEEAAFQRRLNHSIYLLNSTLLY